MGRQPDAREVAPAVQKLRVHFAKRGRLRFTSHRDFQRVFERAIRRAGVPVAYSAGFSPHPKISYVGAASTGAASEAEYLEISVTQTCDPVAVREALDEALPTGFDIIEVVEARGGSLPDRIDTSRWQVTLNGVTTGGGRDERFSAFFRPSRYPSRECSRMGAARWTPACRWSASAWSRTPICPAV